MHADARPTNRDRNRDGTRRWEVILVDERIRNAPRDPAATILGCSTLMDLVLFREAVPPHAALH